MAEQQHTRDDDPQQCWDEADESDSDYRDDKKNGTDDAQPDEPDRQSLRAEGADTRGEGEDREAEVDCEEEATPQGEHPFERLFADIARRLDEREPQSGVDADARCGDEAPPKAVVAIVAEPPSRLRMAVSRDA